jgi:membrane-associated PAP2 superfamily phosphatase
MTAPFSQRRLAVITLALMLILMAWDATDLDMRLAHWFGTAQGFPLTDNWLLEGVLHEGGRRLSWVVALALTLAVWWPFGSLRRLESRERGQLILGSLAAVLLVSLLKSVSPASCPWDLSAFGGVARHLSHWSWTRDGGSGHCFPAGHASSGFAFIGGYFIWRRHSARVARNWLLLSLLAGFTLGFAQQARGAHFMSHTLWTGWLCWSVGLAIDAGRRVSFSRLRAWLQRGQPSLPQPVTDHRPAHADRATSPPGR